MTPTTASTAPILSVLLCSIPERHEKLFGLFRQLQDQIVRLGRVSDIEILSLVDNKTQPIGKKRNALIAAARGRFVAFIDDDDRVSDRYLEAIVTELDRDPNLDVVCFSVWVSGWLYRGLADRVCIYGRNLPHGENAERYTRAPNHIMVWKKRTAQMIPFPEVFINEDTMWAEAMRRLIRTEVCLTDVLYYYQHDANASVQTSQ